MEVDGDFVIVGTAGHIDHGKTAMVRALTGMDTDHLREEKERGISIDIGFAPLLLSGGQRLGIVDVPGHERFIRNMLAGAGGIDLILLVVDAREGVMEQTREHLAILELLDISRGLIVITKTDLVDADWLDMVHHEVRADLRHSFLEHAPMLDVSSVTGAGIDELKQAIEAELPYVRKKSRSGAFRLPIDRVFTVSGFGTVVTGTVWRGSAKAGDMLELLPSQERVRVRSLQVHGQAVEEVVAGQRAAVAISGVRQVVQRGMTLGLQGAYDPTRLLDVRVKVLRDTPWSLAHRMRVRLYTGTAEVFGRILLLGEQLELLPGEEGLAQLLLETHVVVEAKDHFVLRTYSPMHTIGGGTVIDAHPGRLHRRHSKDILARLLRREHGTVAERLLDMIGQTLTGDLATLAAGLDESQVVVQDALSELLQMQQVRSIGQPPFYVSNLRWREWLVQVERLMADFYNKNKYDLWIPKPVLMSGLKAIGLSVTLADALLREAELMETIAVVGERVRAAKREVVLTPVEREMHARIGAAFCDRPTDPPGLPELEGWFHGKERMVKNVLRLLDQESRIVAVAPDVYFSVEAVGRAEAEARALWQEEGAFGVAAFRDRLGTSRKYAVALLEYLDRQKRTKRVGDAREFIG